MRECRRGEGAQSRIEAKAQKANRSNKQYDGEAACQKNRFPAQAGHHGKGARRDV
ncbi:hypothetical protein AA15669_0511 [Saccharibacter floricola DSM 15669]|uniref:Uncharacterized protein n=1 Tax=Saccharibacter floricola DSM 15669 TaxID=1123227 RepID=A0ABQ0NXD7_9PROT|nr:hypothetical protein AA15669_0511 [Saccharibacter floricola DSM 15669]